MRLVEFLAASLLAYFATRHPDIVIPETPAELRARVAMIGEMSVRACDEEFPAAGFPGGFPREVCVAWIVTVAKWESGLWVTVHAGTRKGPGGETCLVQIDRQAAQIPNPRFRVTLEEWKTLSGTDPAATLRCLRAGVRILGWHAKRCGLTWKGDGYLSLQSQTLFSEYHRPGGCYGLARQSADRASSAAILLGKIRALPP